MERRFAAHYGPHEVFQALSIIAFFAVSCALSRAASLSLSVIFLSLKSVDTPLQRLLLCS